MLPENNAIIGVEFKSLVSHPDGRGFFREIFRASDNIFEGGQYGQWSHSKMQKNVVKAWHYHHIQTDWWYVPIGEALVVLYDYREESPTYETKLEFQMGDSNPTCVRIPPGVLHACQVLSEEAHLFYITSETYNPDDEGRIAYNSDLIPHEWPEDAITSERDRVDFVPSNPRKLL